MYQVVKEPVAWIDVEWQGLDEEGFEQTNSIRMQVAFLPLSEMEGLLSGESEEKTIEFAKRVSRDWSQIRGPDGKPWPFTAENLAALVDLTPGFAIGFQASYLTAYRGRGKVREKNSEGSPPDGQAGEAPEKKKAR
jgi:hypothetical protein